MEGLDWGAALLRAARAADLVASLGIFGTLLFTFAIALPLTGGEAAQSLLRRLRLVLGISLAVSLLGAAAWLPAQAAQTGDASSLSSLWQSIRIVASDTTFGRALLARTLLLVAAVWIAASLDSRIRTALGTCLAAVALGLQARLGHAAAADGWLLPVAESLHVLAAGAWFGGLLPLVLTLNALNGKGAEHAARRFSWIGMSAVAILVLTAVFQVADLVGDLGGWLGTSYGLVALAKIAGLIALLFLAALNRWIFTPRLAGRHGDAARRQLAISIAVETLVGLGVVLAAVLLATLPPGAHEQSVWPFPQRPDPAAWGDAFARRQAWNGLALAGAVLTGLASLFWRRTRLLGPIAACAAFLWLPSANWRLLAKPAYPTSYYRSETGFTVASIARGGELLRQHCTSECFRPTDDPSDLSPYGIWGRPDGDFFWWLTAVFDVIGHSPFEHGTIARLSERERWLLIDYFRARVAGSAVKRTGSWAYPVLTPDLRIACQGRQLSLSDLKGRVVHLVVRADGRLPVLQRPPDMDIATVAIVRNDAAISASAGSADCASSSPDAWTALALMAGVPDGELDGTRFLIDANGWLRRRWLGASPVMPERWQEDARRVAEAPFTAANVGSHRH